MWYQTGREFLGRKWWGGAGDDAGKAMIAGAPRQRTGEDSQTKL
jgi:hypothetical protein